MTEESKKVEVQVVEDLGVDPKTAKAIEKIAEKTVLMIAKRDYRATMVHREERAEIPDSEAALIHIDEESQDELGNPQEYDVKGNITAYEAWMFRDVNYGIALTNLRDWWYFEVPVEKYEDGKKVTYLEKVPINLAQIDMMSKKRLNLGIGGHQSWMHIHERRANSGMPPDESAMNKVYGFMGFKKEKVAPEKLQEQYGSSVKK